MNIYDKIDLSVVCDVVLFNVCNNIMVLFLNYKDEKVEKYLV